MSYNYEMEVREAIEAGERSLQSLRLVQGELNSAGNWGIVDILGGGLITDLFKHSKMNNASRYMDEARYDLQRFQRELRDVTINTNLNINVGDFLTFADFFFDGFIADIMMQSKIKDAKRQVEEAIYRVEMILNDLRRTV